MIPMSIRCPSDFTVGKYRLKRPRSGHVIPLFFQCRFLSWRPISSIQHLAWGLCFPLLLKFKGISASKLATYIMTLDILDIFWYQLYRPISATCFKHQTSRGVQLSGGKPMPRRVIHRGEFTAANSGLKKMGGRWPVADDPVASIDGIRMYTLYV